MTKDITSPIIPGEDDSPYKVVREESTVKIYDGVKTTHTTGYDAQNRVVLQATYKDYPGGSKGHCVRIVEKDGYWSGGAYDPVIGQGCQFAREKFIDEQH